MKIKILSFLTNIWMCYAFMENLCDETISITVSKSLDAKVCRKDKTLEASLKTIYQAAPIETEYVTYNITGKYEGEHESTLFFTRHNILLIDDALEKFTKCLNKQTLGVCKVDGEMGNDNHIDIFLRASGKKYQIIEMQFLNPEKREKREVILGSRNKVSIKIALPRCSKGFKCNQTKTTNPIGRNNVTKINVVVIPMRSPVQGSGINSKKKATKCCPDPRYRCHGCERITASPILKNNLKIKNEAFDSPFLKSQAARETYLKTHILNNLSETMRLLSKTLVI